MHSSPTPPLLLAEAVTFDPGFVVAVFLVLALASAVVVATIVLGIASARRFGRDRHDRRAATIWSVCLILQAPLVLASFMMLDDAPAWTAAGVALPASSVVAFALARRRAGTHGAPADR